VQLKDEIHDTDNVHLRKGPAHRRETLGSLSIRLAG
jgi:hypothetical protein